MLLEINAFLIFVRILLIVKRRFDLFIVENIVRQLFSDMRRGKERWTHADDERLGRALLSVFADHGEEIVLSDSCALWKRVQQEYQGLLATEQVVTPDITAAQRSARSLHTRWARGIRPDMTLFASLVDKVWKVVDE